MELITKRDALNELYLSHYDVRYIDKYECKERIEKIKGFRTKQVKYFDETEQVWKIGEVIVDETD